jgi:hypothetical protein
MLRTVIICSLIVSAPAAFADVLLLDGIEIARQSANGRPTRGSSMERVEASFGAPTMRHSAIGAPPITRWDYPGFVVYFEYQHVIHAVATP